MAEPVVPDQIIAGKYRVERTLGEGGMGIVVAARHLELDQLVAIKFLRPEIAQQGDAAERFRREARAAVRVRSEHICRVLDVGTLETGVPYMVMEYLEGHDLSSELHDRRQLPVEEAVDYVLQACDAIAEAHASGIVHRDLKPANLFLARTSGGSRGIKVLDFGVSKSVIQGETPQLQLTKTSSLIGSPIYMCPEQLEASRDIDGRADVWGLATILYELITGRTPFVADTIAHLVRAIMIDAPPSFAELGVEAPAELEAVVLRALSKQKATRFESVRDFSNALLPFAPAHSRSSSRRQPSRGSLAPGHTAVSPRQESPRLTPRDGSSAREPGRFRNRWFAAAAVLAFGAVLAFVALRRSPAQAPASDRAEPSSASALVLAPVAPRAATEPPPSGSVTAIVLPMDSAEDSPGNTVAAAPPASATKTVVGRALVTKTAIAALESRQKQTAVPKGETRRVSGSASTAGAAPENPTASTFRDFGGRR